MDAAPIRQRVTCDCPLCKKTVPTDRTTYPDAVYFTCIPRHHSWTLLPVERQHIPGRSDCYKAPAGYHEGD